MRLPRKSQLTYLGRTRKQWLEEAKNHDKEARRLGSFPGPREPYLDECERAAYARRVAAQLKES